MDTAQFAAALVGMSLVTYASRVLPLLLFGQRQLPQWFLSFVSHIPVAILSALLFQSLFVMDGEVVTSLGNPMMAAAIPTVLAAYLTRSLYGTVVVGLITMALLRFFVAGA